MPTALRWAVPWAVVIAWWPAATVPAGDDPPAQSPRVHDERLTLTCFARQPDIVTPTGVVVTADGAVVAIECHTHFPPRDYPGPKVDRIRASYDDDGDGVSDRTQTVYEGTAMTMGLLLAPGGGLVVATRNEVFRLDDGDRDGRLDKRTPLVRLETQGNYPHNGLGGLAADSQGRLYLGMGENLGVSYRLIGSDGGAWSGGGEGGNVFRVAADGSRLERWATGFWNPFALVTTPSGHLFGVDNDPDSRPPCRLLDIVPGGDFGYRYRYGRKGLHPFNAWNGELPGTLPMVAGTGEAPSGIVWYDGRGLPAEYRHTLLVTSWGDHRIERYRLEPWGASFRASAEVIVSGGEDFRPVGLAVGPDGALYFSDWVDKAYEVHGQGRLWRLGPPAVRREAKPAERAPSPAPVWHAPSPESLAGPGEAELAGDGAPAPLPADARAAYLAHADHVSVGELRAALGQGDPFVTTAARWRLARHLDDALLNQLSRSPIAAERWTALALERDRIDAGGAAADRIREGWGRFLADPDPRVRFSAIEQVAAREWREFRPRLLADLTRASESGHLVEAELAALDWLDRPERRWKHDVAGESYLVELLARDDAAPALVIYALRALPPEHPALTPERLTAWLDHGDPTIALEATRTWRLSTRPERSARLLMVAGEHERAPRQRAEAVLGLSPGEPAERSLLLAAALEPDAAVRREAWRALRGAELTPDEQAALAPSATRVDAPLARAVLGESVAASPSARPPRDDLASWQARMPQGDAAAGERVFFDPRGVGCFRCHRRAGRGATVGPDLTPVAEQTHRERILQSLLEPSREVAPQFVTWNIATSDGRTLSGVLWQEEAAGRRTFVAASGEPFALDPTEIESLGPSPLSLMPDNLVDTLSDAELADLLAYLGGGEE